MTEPKPALYALLIGIDYYQPNRLYKSLRGAVRDINLVDTYLQTLQPKQIWKLLSAEPEASGLSNSDSAGLKNLLKNLPTYANIIAAFDEITAIAQPGELVYIHYSGHGGRATTLYPELKGEGQTDEGLVPMDIGEPTGQYIRDVEIATLLKRMTDRGLLVTVVLDSCHSGGATRGDSQIRSSESGTDTAPRSAESQVASRPELLENWQRLTSRSKPGAAGLPEPRDYVLLAACRPNEYAYEYTVEPNQRHGALTYWMINTLANHAGQPLTYKLLYDRINAQIQSRFPQQLPMILGESRRLVWGVEAGATPYQVTVMSINAAKAEVTLNAGLAQGLSKGTRFSIYPFAQTAADSPPIAAVEVTKAEAGTAVARILAAESGRSAADSPADSPANSLIEPGAPAVMTAAPIDLVRRVALLDQKQPGAGEAELPHDWVNQQVVAMAAVRQAMAGNGWVVEAEANQPSDYQVAVGRAGEYEICIETPLPNLRPLLPITDPQAAETVVKRLVHLTKYQAVQSLSNPRSKLAAALELQLLDQDQQPFPDGERPAIRDGEQICLRLMNRGQQPLKVVILDLDPTWAITQLDSQGIEAQFYNLDPQERYDLMLMLSLPEDAAYAAATETLKVFAIQTGLADFRWLELPPLDQPFESRGEALNQALQETVERATRGGAAGLNPLNALLATIGADLDQPPQTMRAATVLRDPKDDWVTQQVSIEIRQF